MPYNVICFVCTVIAIGFGSIFNLTTRSLVPETDANSRGVLARFFGFFWRKNNQDETLEDKNDKEKNIDMNSDPADPGNNRTGL